MLNSDLLGLRAPHSLALGRGQLQIEFSGVFGELAGLFRQQAGQHWYAYSDFEPIDARAAFPSYDDPRFKVPFEIELRVPAAQRAFSNAPNVGTDDKLGGDRIVRFAPTRPLPTYLVAVAVGPFDSIQTSDAGPPIRVIAPRGTAEAGRFALESTRAWIEYLETYLGMSMPFRKLDFIAVPVFNGAMENPGLVTVTAGILLTGPSPSATAKRRVAGVIAHELAHLWFGDLLTPNYWDDLWLNEAFATWLSDKVLAAWDPQHAREILDIADKTAAYPLDHRLDGRAVRHPIKEAKDIHTAFDAITYRKGGALLTMLEGWLGEVPMRKVVQAYLHGHVDGTVIADDLIEAFAQSMGPGAHDFFRRYLGQTGIADIAVEIECKQGVRAKLRQSRYLPLGTKAQSSPEDRTRLWHLPVCLRFPVQGDTGRLCVMMTQETLVVPLPTQRCPSWVLPNDRETGYYHYQLDAKAFYALLHAPGLDPRERVGLVTNIVGSWRSGGLSLQEVMPLLALGAKDTDSSIQQIIIPLLYSLSQDLIGAPERPAFQAMIRNWYGARVEALGIETRLTDSTDDKLMRPSLLRLVGDLGGDQSIRHAARTWIIDWLQRPSRVSYELLDSLLHLAAIDGDQSLHDAYLKMLAKVPDPLSGELILGAMLSFRKPALFAKSLEALKTQGLRPNTAHPLARAMTRAPQRKAVNELLLNNRPALIDRMKTLSPNDDRSKLFEVLSLSMSLLCDEQGLTALTDLAGDDFEVSAIANEIKSCIAFAASQRANAQEFFAAN